MLFVFFTCLKGIWLEYNFKFNEQQQKFKKQKAMASLCNDSMAMLSIEMKDLVPVLNQVMGWKGSFVF